MKWIYEWEKPCTPYYVYTFLSVFMYSDPQFLSRTNCCFTAERHRVMMYFRQDSLDKSGLIIKDKILNSNFLETYPLEVGKNILKMHQIGEKVLKEKNPLLFAEFFQSIVQTTFGVGTIRCFNRLGAEECEQWLDSKIKDPKQRAEAFSILVGNSKKSLSQRQQEEFYALFLYVSKQGILEKDQQLKQMIAAHLKKYQWFPCGYENEAPWDENHLLTELKAALQDKTRTIQKFESIRKYHRKIENHKLELLNKLNPPREIRLILEALALFTYYKDYLRENLNKHYYTTRPYLELVSKEIGLLGLQCTELLPTEVITLLEKKETFKGELLGNQDYVFDFDESFKILRGPKAKKFMESISSSEASEVQGLCASAGKVVGTVKKLFRPTDYHGETNFVLVAPMTNPDLILAARNAVAIVTDEGGTTCHAAIISREMQIPCITGTGNGTKMLQDGDLVEVDAHNGTVKILKRVNPK